MHLLLFWHLLTRGVGLHPSIHLKPNWRAVNACKVYHDHTFVSVPVITHCSSPWPPCRSVLQDCIAPVCKDLARGGRLYSYVQSERQRKKVRTPPPPPPCSIWVTFTCLDVWHHCQFKRGSHTEYLSVPFAVFWFQIKIDCHPIPSPFLLSLFCPLPPPLHCFFFFAAPAHIQIFWLWLRKEFTALSLPICSW